MKEKEEQQKQQERVPVVGIVTGVSYVSGIDYYKQLNELFISHQQQRQQQQQNQNQNQNQNQQQQQQQPSTPFNNPPILLNSIDCATYVYHLKKENYFSVCQLFVDAVKCLVGVVDVVGFASNTAHISFKAVKEAYPKLNILHIGDTTAKAIKETNSDIHIVGLLGTQPTMTLPYLVERLGEHGFTTLVPEEQKDKEKIYNYIVDEMSFGVFSEECRLFFIEKTKELVKRGAQAIVLGCTEIELLNLEPLLPSYFPSPPSLPFPPPPLFRSGQLHIEGLSAVQRGVVSLESFLPKK